MISFFKKKKIVPLIRLSGVIGNVGKFKQGIDLTGQEELIKKEFNKKYLSLFEVVDLDSEIEIIQWNAKISCKTSRTNLLMEREFIKRSKLNYRNVYIKNEGFKKIKILNFNQL